MANNETFKEKLKSDITSMSWWYGTLGNILSTVIGIALTFGVTALVSRYQDKQDARELMFNVVATCERNMHTVEKYDSIVKAETASIDTLVEFYHSTDGWKKGFSHDTLQRCFDRITKSMFPGSTHSTLSSYFFTTQTMHQIGNADIYQVFSDFVDADRVIFEQLDAFNQRNTELVASIFEEAKYSEVTGREIIAENIENKKLTRYAVDARFLGLSVKADMYRHYLGILLSAMGATEEEYEEFKKNNTSAVDGEDYHHQEDLLQ